MAEKTRKRKYPLNEDSFKVLSRDCAYWIGYLYGDGNCTRENVVRLCCAAKDKDLLYSFRDFIHCITKPVKEFLSTLGYPSVRFDIRSWKIHKDLSKYQLNKRKELRGHLHPDLMQKEIFADFLRGLFDADGTFYYDGLHKNHLFAEITGYKNILIPLKQALVSAEVIKDKKKIIKNGRIFRIRFPKEACIKLGKFMYKDSPKYYLRRKYGLFKQYLDRLNEETQKGEATVDV